MDIMEYVKVVAMFLLGGLALYVQYNKKVQEKIAEITAKAVALIKEAEEIYKDTSKSGGAKKAWVVEQLYRLVPKPLNMIITKDMIDQMVESTFQEIENYAKQQLDKYVDKIE